MNIKEFFSKKEITLGGYLLPTKWFYWIGGVLGALVLIPIIFNIIASLFYSVGLGGASYQTMDAVYSLDDMAFDYDGAIYEESRAVAFESAEAQGLYASAPAADTVGLVTEKSANSINVAPQDRLIVYTGNLYMSVDDPEETREAIQTLVNEYSSQGAFVVSASQSGSGSDLYVSMSIRVPSGQFGGIMEHMAGMSKEIISRSENAADVTEEFVDLENRIESMEAARDRLLEIMQNADTTEDLLRAEQQLTYRETEIESLKGRKQYLASAASLSRIDITLTPYIVSQPIDTSWKPMKAVREAIDELLYNSRNFVENVIDFIIVGIPSIAVFVFLLWLAWLAARFVWRQTFGRTRKKEENETQTETE